MNLVQRIAAKQSDRRKKLEVAEWGDEGKALVVNHGPWLAIDQERLNRLHPKWMETLSSKAFVEAIVMKAEDADGNRLFDADAKAVLMREPAILISRVAGAIMSFEGIEDQEKN